MDICLRDGVLVTIVLSVGVDTCKKLKVLSRSFKLTNVEQHYLENRDTLVKKLSCSMGKMNAEDIVQDTYVRMLNQVEEEMVPDAFEVIFSDMLKKSINQYYKQERSKGIVRETLRATTNETLDQYGFKELDPEQKYTNTEVMKAAYHILVSRQRPTPHYPILYSYYMNNLPLKDVCDKVGTDYSTAHKIVSRFMEEVRKEIDD